MFGRGNEERNEFMKTQEDYKLSQYYKRVKDLEEDDDFWMELNYYLKLILSLNYYNSI